jgi:phosphohistidine phosphatase
MKLILVRHGVAEHSASSDRDRALSSEGRKRTKRAADGLARMVDGKARIFSSPFVRATETAKIVADALEPHPKIKTLDSLALGVDDRSVLKKVHDDDHETVILVGHEPNLSSLASWLLVGNGDLSTLFKKSAALCIGFGGRPDLGKGRLEWFLPPRVLRHLPSD